MDLNLVIINGRLAAPPEVREFESGRRLVRMLVTVRAEQPRRVDVIPVTLWDAPEAMPPWSPGDRVWVAASVQRRFWDQGEGRRSRLEIIAQQVVITVIGDGDLADTYNLTPTREA